MHNILYKVKNSHFNIMILNMGVESLFHHLKQRFYVVGHGEDQSVFGFHACDGSGL
jgi:hypothetical protein